MKIIAVETEQRRLPLGRLRVSLTEARPARTESLDAVLVRLRTDAGLDGIGFTYVIGPGASALRTLIETDLAALVVGEDRVRPDGLFSKVQATLRAAGFTGLAA